MGALGKEGRPIAPKKEAPSAAGSGEGPLEGGLVTPAQLQGNLKSNTPPGERPSCFRPVSNRGPFAC